MVGGHRSDANVKKDSGADLLQTWNAYLGERIIKVPKGTYTLPSPLIIPDSAVARDIIVQGCGEQKTIIQGSAPLADDALIRSDEGGWHAGDGVKLVLRDIQFKGSGVEQYLLNLSYVLTDFDRLDVRGSLRVAGDGIYINCAGSGPPSVGTRWGYVKVRGTGTADTGILINTENFSAENIHIGCDSGNLTTGLKAQNMNVNIGNLGAYIGNAKSLTRVLYSSALSCRVSTMSVLADATPTLNPFPVKATGGIVDIDTLNWTMALARPHYCEDTASKYFTKLHELDLYRYTTATKTDPGVAYVLWDAAYDATIDVTDFDYAQIFDDSAVGNEAGADKGIEWYNSTNAAPFCAVTWDGAGTGVPRVGPYTDISALSGEKALRLYVKASSVTEDITIGSHLGLRLARWRPRTT